MENNVSISCRPLGTSDRVHFHSIFFIEKTSCLNESKLLYRSVLLIDLVLIIGSNQRQTLAIRMICALTSFLPECHALAIPNKCSGPKDIAEPLCRLLRPDNRLASKGGNIAG